MKKYLLILFVTLKIVTAGWSQNIGINATGALPNASAMLDVSAPNKGILIPRTSSTSRIAIPNPAKGLMLYDTTSNSFWYHNGSLWIELNTGGGGGGSSIGWSLNGTNIFNSNSGNVGIGTNGPLAGLHIKKDLETIRMQGASPFVSFYNKAGDSMKAFIQNVNNDLFLGTPSANADGLVQVYAKNSPAITVLPSGKVGVGTVTPEEKFTVNTAGYGLTHSFGTASIGSWIGNFNGITTVKFGTKSNHPLSFFTANSLPQMTIATSGNVGIGTEEPTNKLTLLTTDAELGFTHTTASGGKVATYLNGNRGGIGTFSVTDMQLYSGGATAMTIGSDANHYIGIGTETPKNKLQIGSVGTSAFATNDLAIGNGTAAMAIYQTNTSTLIGATTDIILKPRNNGKGRVGINTDAPRASLEVADYGIIADGYYAYMNGTADIEGIGLCKFCNPQISILAAYGVYAGEFDAFSDARIKNILSVSNSSKDLALINSLRITDYTMKDVVKYGDKPFKKVIAQQVEEIYPQVVSRHKDFIPNVYQKASKVSTVTNGTLVSFTDPHHIGAAAKRLQVMNGDSGMTQFEIVSIPSDRDVIIKANNLKADQLFVYGEEVDDFRTVDYEGLSTLNISATQELSKLVAKQSEMINKQQVLIDGLMKRLEALEKK